MNAMKRFARFEHTAALSGVLVSSAFTVMFLAGVAVSQPRPPAPQPIPTTLPLKRGSTQILREIKPGQTVSDVMTRGAYHGWAMTLLENTAVECRLLNSRETWLSMTVVAPDGELAIPGNVVPTSVDVGRISAGITGSVEPLVIVAERPATYVIRVSSDLAGRYSITCGQAHATTESDRQYYTAQKLFLEIRKNFEAGKPILQVRDKVFQRAEIYRSLDDQLSLMLALGDVISVAWEAYEFEVLLAVSNEALEISTNQGNRDDQIRALTRLRNIYEMQGDYQRYFETQARVIALSTSEGPTIQEAWARFNYGVMCHRLADEEKAREYYERAFKIFSSIHPATADSLNGMMLYNTNMANLARGMSGGEIKIDSFPPRTRDDYKRAVEYLGNAIELNTKIRTQFPGASHLSLFNYLQLANTYKELGNYDDALGYLDGILHVMRPGETSTEAAARVLAGSVLIKKGEVAKASENFDRVIKLLRDGANDGNRIGYLLGISRDYGSVGEYERAREVILEAIEASRSRRLSPQLAEALLELGNVERELGNFNNARKSMEEAMEIAETLRLRITDAELRTTYFSTVKRFYDSYVDLLMQSRKGEPGKGFDGLALRVSERARSRTLLDLLMMSGVNLSEGVEPELVAREKAVREKLSIKALQQSRLSLRRHDPAASEKIAGEIETLLTEHSTVESAIRGKSPRYAALTQPSLVSLKDVQGLLDSGTILLEYALGDKRSYLWVVSKNAIASYDLPPRSEIEKQAREVYGFATARNTNLAGETPMRHQARATKADALYVGAARRLSQTVLGPAAAQLKNKRIAIVPDGALSYVSFAALPAPDGSIGTAGGNLYFGQSHEVVTLASASTLARLREQMDGRKPAAKVLAVFADPVFSDRDQRAAAASLKSATSKAAEEAPLASARRDFERAIESAGLASNGSIGLARLPFSRREATSIFRNVPSEMGMMRLDFDANRSSVFDRGLDNFRILHFATHGLLDTRNPELSGLVLSLVDPKGSDVDGFLRLQDVYNLHLNADLVVLSGCSTALGKEVRGEGLISLTRGFMYAGSPRIVASLWKVDDAATAVLMSIFYRKMLAENLRPAAALRAAQMEMMKQTRWKSPYYWAPFVLQGEWR